MKVRQVADACAEAIKFGAYLSVRNRDGRAYGYNPNLLNVSFIAQKAENNAEKESWIISFRYISLDEYITTKKPLFRGQ